MTKKTSFIVEFLKGKSASKSKFYFKDFTELFPDKGPREVKKILTKLVNEEVLEFWSSGSTTMYGLKGAGKQAHTEGED
ncbi:dissimilatory sulfite reductase D family protein [Desulfovibrio sp.]|uniref:dissimilatory sulfite reductase D family protein n=1 Tax=Desulfovibrio sp. TaxID=885 RepID=UPI00257CD638|nr:dissimilatory sulfite reductase D family protein [Desulfovibrio sp.]MBR2610902.1 dissimilatory sulfite reductase D family protein [Desulfovibrio sp.]